MLKKAIIIIEYHQYNYFKTPIKRNIYIYIYIVFIFVYME